MDTTGKGPPSHLCHGTVWRYTLRRDATLMSTRPALPKSIPRWPFILGDIAFLILALVTLAFAGSPPGLGSIVLATICVVIGIALLIAPYLIEYDARIRFAEAQAKDVVEIQMRRVGQMTEQLANVVSRSQSIEEQVGQALGSIEEIADKLGAQSDDVAQLLSKAGGPMTASVDSGLKDTVESTAERLASLEEQVSSIGSALAKAKSAGRDARASTSTTLEAIARQLDDISGRLENAEGSESVASAATKRPKPAGQKPISKPKPKTPPEKPAGEPEESATGPKEPLPDPKADAEIPEEKPESAGEEPPAAEKPVSDKPPDAARTSAKPKKKPVPRKAAVESLELPLEGAPNSPPTKRRESGPATSLVATAYIGIGNKLYIRGEGPGLSWDEGAPMQFLAIGKWGWTSTEADGQIVCRIYRNDDTPMLDEDIILEPGGKVEVTPRF